MASPAAFAGVTAGTHKVKVVLENYVTIEKRVKVGEGEHRSMSLMLSPLFVETVKDPADSTPSDPKVDKRDKKRPKSSAPGHITIRTRPYSNVYINGKKLGTTPFAGRPLKPGTYTLTFKNPDYKTVKKTIKIRPGKSTKLDFPLRK
jgi:serine/threonine-protein kinase